MYGLHFKLETTTFSLVISQIEVILFNASLF
jgi:hypothetical protein